MIKVDSDREVLKEMTNVLLEHLSPSAVARFWAGWQLGEGDYTRLRRSLFETETVASLIEKVRAYEQQSESSDT